jgi:tetratricopeptide (TPR) repeat protein
MKDFNYALMLIKAKKYDGAREIFEELLKGDPRDKDILYNLGMCYSELGKPEKAVRTLSECVKHYPNYSNAYVALGFAHTMLGKDGKAKENFLRALEIDPVNSYAMRNLGGIYGKENNYDKSIECLEKSFSINPEDQQTAYGLGYSYFHAGRLDKSDEYLKIAIDIDGTTEIAKFSKDMRGKIAEINLKKAGFRTDAMFYCLAALQFFKDKTKEQVNRITLEIALKGRQGLDINDPDQKYNLNTMKGSFSGLQLFSYMYVGFKIIDPSVDLELDISQEYKEALNLFEQEKTSGPTIH